MHDDVRSQACRTVYLHLRRAAFRECLPVVDETGNRPLVVALPHDRMTTVLAQVRAVGGSGNVVVARATDLVILAVTRDGRGAARMPSDGTVGEFISSLMARKTGEKVRRGERATARPVSVPVCA